MLKHHAFVCEGQGDEVDAAAAEEAAISPTQAGTQSAVARRRRIARTAIQKPRGPLSTKPQDMQVRFCHDGPMIYSLSVTNMNLLSYCVAAH